MIKKLYFLALSAVLGIMVLVSCQKENIVTQGAVKFDNFSLIEGRLAFDNEASFRKTLDELYLSQEELNQWEKAIPGYISMRTQFETMTDENAEELINKIEENKYIFTLIEEVDGELSMERNIYNDVLATLISKDGFLQIGTTVYRFTYDYFYSVDLGNIDLLKVREINDANPHVSKTQIKREFVHEDANSVSLRAQTIGECTKRKKKKRTKGLILRETVFDNDCIIRTKHQRKKFGIWWANKTSISVSFSGNFTKIWSSCSPSPIAFFSGSSSSSNASSRSRVVPGNHSSFNGCNGSATPFHDGLYSSTHTAGGKTCTLSCPPGAPCN